MKVVYSTLNKIFNTQQEAIEYENSFLNNYKAIALDIVALNRIDKLWSQALASQFTNNIRFDFGKYKGQFIGKIIIKDKTYIDWCLNNINNFKLTNKGHLLYNIRQEEIAFHNIRYDIIDILEERYLVSNKDPYDNDNKDFTTTYHFMTSESVLDDLIF